MIKITVEKFERCEKCRKKSVCAFRRLFKLIPRNQIIEINTALTNDDIPVPIFTMYCDEYCS